VYTGEKSVNCAACHNVRVNLSDTVNWNPDAYEIAKKYKNLEISELESVLLSPRGQKLSEVHEDFDLSTEDITMIKAYMDIVAEDGLIQPKPLVTELILFILALVLILFSITDLIITRKISAKWIHAVIIIGGGFFITKIMVEEAIAIGRSENYSPDQPIKFSHTIHAGQNKTDCLYCHASAEYSKSAGIPGSNVCMNCHLIVRNGTRSGAWEINKVIQAHENGEAIEWIRVHNNPDHVFFSHAQHVSIGGVECQECHGEVESMDRIVQVSDLSMGWCIECHRESEVNFHSNEFYNNYENLRQMVNEGEIDAVTVEKVGGIECMKCHY
ncbi:MAG: cytochrome c3 family protein, partial [Bacteroidales bacterium]